MLKLEQIERSVLYGCMELNYEGCMYNNYFANFLIIALFS